MRKTFILIMLVSICIFATSAGIIQAEDLPRPYATEVTDVFEPYTAEEWIVSPEDESTGDEKVDNAPECDISGVIACYDGDYLRFDILLNSGISYDWAVWYAVKLVYDDMTEYFTYFTDTEKLVYEKVVNGEIVKSKVLAKNDSDDFAGVVDSGDGQDDDVYFIINKAEHIGGEKGNLYFIPCSFLSGYVDADNKLHIADETMPVEMLFTY